MRRGANEWTDSAFQINLGVRVQVNVTGLRQRNGEREELGDWSG